MYLFWSAGVTNSAFQDGDLDNKGETRDWRRLAPQRQTEG
jgi:hypothetical protein